MSQKYAIPVTLATEELCVFLNDGHPVTTPSTVLLIEINGPREITSKLCPRDEVFEGIGWTPKDPDVTIIVAE